MNPTPQSRSLKHTVIALLVCCIGAIVIYAMSLNHPFVIDDHTAIVNHPDVIKTQGLIQLWGHHYWQGTPSQDANLYRPITIFSYWLNWQITPGSALGFRLVNVLLLGGIGACVFLWAKRFAGAIAAGIVAAILIVHPSNTEAINHIVGRADLLAVLGVMGFLVIQQNAQLEGWSPKRIASCICFALIALGSKESGYALIPAAAAQYFLFRPASNTNQRNETSGKDACHNALGICPKRAIFLSLFLPVALMIAARLLVVGLPISYEQAVTANVGVHDLTVNPLTDKGLIDRLPDSFGIAGWYVKQLVYPATTFNHTPSAVGRWSALSVLGLAVYGGLIAAFILLWRKRRPLVIPVILFASHLLIVGNLLFPTGVYAANRLTLATSTAGVLLLAILIAPLLQSTYRKRMITITIAAMVAFTLATATAIANTHWSSEHARMTADAKAQQNNPIALYWFAQASLQDDINQPHTAYIALNKAVMLAPDSHQAALALADVCVLVGQNEEAWEIYTDPARQHLTLTNNQQINAALAAYNTGRFKEAETRLRRLPDTMSEALREFFRQSQTPTSE